MVVTDKLVTHNRPIKSKSIGAAAQDGNQRQNTYMLPQTHKCYHLHWGKKLAVKKKSMKSVHLANNTKTTPG